MKIDSRVLRNNHLMIVSCQPVLYFLIQVAVFLILIFYGCFLVQFVYFLRLVLKSLIFLFQYSIAGCQDLPVFFYFLIRYSCVAASSAFASVRRASVS